MDRLAKHSVRAIPSGPPAPGTPSQTTPSQTTPSQTVPRAMMLAALLAAAASACGSPDPALQAAREDPVPLPTYEDAVRPSDGLLTSPELQEVVDLQVDRDGAALRERLESPDPGVRARAALALASVQDPDARPALERLLADPVAAVRADAAFALGQIELPDGGSVLADALAGEEAPGARLRILEAIGKRGGEEAVAALLTLDLADGEEPARTLALARAGLRGVRPQGLVGALLDRLTAADGAVRETAAYYFGRAPNPDAWRAGGDRVREALDGYALDEPAAMHLVSAVARLSDLPGDGSRLLHWLEAAEDWRTRANVIGVLASPVWLGAPGVAEAFFDALDDPSPHVRYAAAGGVALVLWNQDDPPRSGEALLDGPAERWRIQARILPPLAALGQGERILQWTRRMADHHPVATIRGVEALAGLSGPTVTELLFELAEHPEPLVRGVAVRSLGQRWPRLEAEEDEIRRHFELFRERLLDPETLPAARAAQALAHPRLQPLGSAGALEEGFARHREAEDANVLVPILEAMGPASLELLLEVALDDDPRLRAAAAESVLRITGSWPAGMDPPDPDEAAAPVRAVDWELLAQLGPEPRLRIETEWGELVLRLLPEEAPLTVQAFVEEVRRGSHEGVQFHRVVPNFVIQGGDYSMGDGSGSPHYRIRSEFTYLPFGRGVLGMASAGKDTEGSQFYLTHSAQPHLEGGYTAFGWVESGAEALDMVREGDRIVRTSLLEPADGS